MLASIVDCPCHPCRLVSRRSLLDQLCGAIATVSHLDQSAAQNSILAEQTKDIVQQLSTVQDNKTTEIVEHVSKGNKQLLNAIRQLSVGSSSHEMATDHKEESADHKEESADHKEESAEVVPEIGGWTDEMEKTYLAAKAANKEKKRRKRRRRKQRKRRRSRRTRSRRARSRRRLNR